MNESMSYNYGIYEIRKYTLYGGISEITNKNHHYKSIVKLLYDFVKKYQIYYFFSLSILKISMKIQADKFAAELLISDDLDIYEFEDMTTKKISNFLKVNKELVEYKLSNIKDDCNAKEKKI